MRKIRFSFFALLLFLSLSFPRLTPCRAHAADIFKFDVKSTAIQKAINLRVNHPFKLLAQHLYDVILRKGIVPAVLQDMEEHETRRGSSPYHRIARGWHRIFFRHLRVAEFPESWRKAAAGIHKRLGGKGDLLKSLPEQGERRGHFNIRAGKLKSEFLSLALFALWAHVPKGIKTCGPKESVTAVECVQEYAEPLRNALQTTLLTFFRFVVSRYPSSRFVTSAFVLAAVSPCPFGYLIEPRIILASLREDDEYLLNSVATPQKSLKAEPCKDMKMALLKLLVNEGVTPADHIDRLKVDETLQQIEDSYERLVETEKPKLTKAGDVDRSTLLIPTKKTEEGNDKEGKKDEKEKGKEEDDSALALPAKVFQELEDYLTHGPIDHHDAFFKSRIGKEARSAFFSEKKDTALPYQDQVRAFVENQQKFSVKDALKGGLWSEALEEFKAYGEEEEKENPQKVPLRKGKQERDKERRDALYLARKFRGVRKAYKVPEEDEEKKE